MEISKWTEIIINFVAEGFRRMIDFREILSTKNWTNEKNEETKQPEWDKIKENFCFIWSPLELPWVDLSPG